MPTAIGSWRVRSGSAQYDRRAGKKGGGERDGREDTLDEIKPHSPAKKLNEQDTHTGDAGHGRKGTQKKIEPSKPPYRPAISYVEKFVSY